jgi:T5SS/PEP-CTERM-associated repeat protein
MAVYTYIGGPLDQASSWLLGGSPAMNPPGPGDGTDFSGGASPTGNVSVDSVAITGGAFNLTSGSLQTNSASSDGSSSITIGSGGDLNDSGPFTFGADVTIKNGGSLEGGGFSDTFSGNLTVDGSGSTFTEQQNFQAAGQVTFSNGAQVMTGANPADTDVILGSLTVTSGASFTAADITSADGANWTINQGASLDTTGGGNLAGGGAVGAALNGTGTIDGATVNSAGGWAIGSGAPFDGGGPLGLTGTATIQNSANVTLGSLFLGDYSGANGQLTVTGSGTKLALQGDPSVDQVAGVLLVGNDGVGSLTVSGGASLTENITSTIAPAAVAYASDGTGTVIVTGANSSWTTNGTLDIGRRGLGMTTIASGGSLSAAILDVAEFSTSGSAATPSLLDITGSGSKMTASGTVDVGKGGTGELKIEAGGVATLTAMGPSTFLIGDMKNSVGTVDVTGSNSILTAAGTAVVGNSGLATLEVENKGSATIGALIVAAMAASGTTAKPDTVTADGSGSALKITGDAMVDSATPQPSGLPNGQFGKWTYAPSGVGQVEAKNGGYISFGGTVTLQASSDPFISFDVKSGGSIEVGGTGQGQADAIVVDSGGLITGHGTIAADDNGAGSAPGGNVVNSGTIQANEGTLEVDANITGNGTLSIELNATLKIDGSVASGAIVNFDTIQRSMFNSGYTTVLALNDPQNFNGMIQNFTQGDTIDLLNLKISNSGSGVAYAAGTLSVLNLPLIPFSGTDTIPTIGLVSDGNGGTDIITVALQALLDGAFDTYHAPYGGSAITADGYQMLSSAPADAGFEAVAYKDTNPDDAAPSIIVAFRGTSLNQIPAAIKNILADTGFPLGVANALLQRYISDAASFLSSIASANQNAQIMLTGHSLGGAIAQILGKVSGLATAAFNAPGTGQLFGALSGLAGSVANLGDGGTNIDYRVTGDQVSFAGTPLGQTYSLPSTVGTNGSNPVWQVAAQILTNHNAFPALQSTTYTEGFTAPDYITQLQSILQSPSGKALRIVLSVTAGIASLADPGPGSVFDLEADPGSPNISAIALPSEPGVAAYNVAYEINGAFSAFSEIQPATTDNLPAGVTGVMFDPLDASNNPVVIPSSFYFSLTFATSGQFSGTLTEDGGTPVGLPMTTPVTVTLQPNGGATPLGIPAPTDNAGTNSADFAALVTALPTDATILLSDGVTPVTLNESLTIAQLTSLDVQPLTGQTSGSSMFTYSVTDAEFASAAGSATVDIMTCYLEGTRILTSSGLATVETLRPGDEVVTVLGGSGRIVWVGERVVDCTRHLRPQTVWPVRIAAGTFGPGLPERELFVSPDHAIYLDGVLIPAKCLINGTSVRQVKRPRVVYHHIELASHDVVLAEGLAAETYLDVGDRGRFLGLPAVVRHPEAVARIWETKGCAPLVVTGPLVETARRRATVSGDLGDAMAA